MLICKIFIVNLTIILVFFHNGTLLVWTNTISISALVCSVDKERVTQKKKKMHMEILFLFIVNTTSLTLDCECQYQTRI